MGRAAYKDVVKVVTVFGKDRLGTLNIVNAVLYIYHHYSERDDVLFSTQYMHIINMHVDRY